MTLTKRLAPAATAAGAHPARGSYVGRFPDPADQQRELDRYHDGGHRSLSAVPVDAETFVLEPGRGVYVHPFAPHWVRNREAVSISLSITFRTRPSDAAERAHWLNAPLRRLGLHPRPAGQDDRVDRAKAAITHAADRTRTTVRTWRAARAPARTAPTGGSRARS